MKVGLTILLTLLLAVSLITCKNSKEEEFKPKLVYESAILQVTQITENCFIHTSFLQTNDFGNVPCNGLIVSDSKEVIIFDILGKIVLQSTITSKELNVSSLSPGVYMIKIKEGDATATRKLIIK